MQKSFTFTLAVGVALAVLFLGATQIRAAQPVSSAAQDRAEPQRSMIRVSGSAVTFGTPDYATVMIGVTKSSSQLHSAKASCDQAMAKVQAAIKKAGVAPEDIQTASYDIYPVQVPNKPEASRTWKVSHLLSVKVKKVSALSGVLDASANAGATNISRIDYGISNVVALRSKARVEAMRVAREKAQELATIAGMRLGQPTSISEQSYGGYAQTSSNSFVAGFSMAGDGSGLSAGQNSVSVQVDVEYTMGPVG